MRYLIAINLHAPDDDTVERQFEACAARSDDQVEVVYVCTRAHLMDFEGEDPFEKSAEALRIAPKGLALRVAAALENVYGRSPRPPVGLHVRLGHAVPTIVQAAIDYEVDQVVVSTHDRKGLERALLGSVARDLVDAAPCPVLVVRPLKYGGRAKSPKPEPADESRPLHERRPPHAHVYSFSQSLENAHPAGPVGPVK